MRRLFNYLLPAAFACLMLVSCQSDDTERDETLLYGKWLLTTENGNTDLDKEEYWIYYSGGKGKTWDVSEDITEAEALPFTWTLVQSELTQIHVTEIFSDGTRADIPKVYQVTNLTSKTLSYKDRLGYSATFTKQ